LSVAGAEGTLTQEQRDDWERNGYLIVRSPGWTESVIDGALADLDGKYEGDGDERDGVWYYSYSIMDAWKVSESVKTIALHPSMLAILEELYGRKPLPFQTLNFPMGTQQAAHSDAVHFSSMPPGYMGGVWVALEDVDETNGPLMYYPGSHKRPYIHPKDIDAEPVEQEYVKYEKYIQRVIQEENLRPEYGLINKGDALIWSANLLHGGAPQTDMKRTRNSQVTHYFFEGCKYYTPWMSDPETDNIHWRDPAWIS
jgi:hypothetical protein